MWSSQSAVRAGTGWARDTPEILYCIQQYVRHTSEQCTSASPTVLATHAEQLMVGLTTNYVEPWHPYNTLQLVEPSLWNASSAVPTTVPGFQSVTGNKSYSTVQYDDHDIQ